MLLKNKKVMLSAVQPSQEVTLGVYLGALKNWIQLQKDFDCLFFVVDLHTITVRQDPERLRELTHRVIATYLAAGIDPEHALLFVQSHVPEHVELAWVLGCFTHMGELNRMTQFKDKSAKQGKNVSAGLFNYPVLMASDILLYQTNLVPVGEDQKQHVELTRDVAIRINQFYSKTLFTVPEPYFPKIGAKIMSLQDPLVKMSKSDPNVNAVIYLSDSNEVIQRKIKKAVTDLGSEIRETDQKPGIKNLLTLQAALNSTTIEKVAASYVGKQYGQLKIDTAELIIHQLSPIREKAIEILKDRTYLASLLKTGAEQAQERARITLAEVYQQVGFIPGRYHS